MIWITLFYCVFFYALFDGFLGLWTSSKFVLLFRDIMLVGTYFLFFTRENFNRRIGELKRSMGDPAWYAMMGFFLVGLFQIFNPITPGLTLGLLGFKVVYFYWPIMLLGFVYADDMGRVRKFLKMIVYCSIPINIFGLYQFQMGPNWMIGTFGPGMLRALGAYYGLSEDLFLFRALGTFASGGVYAIFLVANAVFCLALMYSSQTKQERLVWIGALVLNLTSILITGTRGALLMLALYLVVFTLLSRRARGAILGALVVIGGFYIGFMFLGERTIERFSTLTDVTMLQERTVETTGKMFVNYMDQYPMGKGLGTASQASRYLGGLEGEFRITVENYASKLQVETGLPGVVLFYAFMIFLVGRWFFDWKYQILTEDQAIIIPLSAYCISQLCFQGIFGSIETSPGSLFLWASVGFTAKRAALGKQAIEYARSQY